MSTDNKSKYYDAGDIETIDIIKAKLTPEQYEGYLLGNILKYSCRLNFKGCSSRDADKLANYSKWLKIHFDSIIDDDLSDKDYSDMDYIADVCADDN